MINAKRANALLWTGNVLLIIGIVAFAFQFLILPETETRVIESPITVPPYGKDPDPTDPTALGKLPNPLVPSRTIEAPGVTRGSVKLLGTFRILDDPEGDTAYLELPSRRLNVNAYVGQPIRDESTGVEVSDLAGWKLKSVTPRSATFTLSGGEERTLEIEEITAAAPTAPGSVPGNLQLAGTAWDANRFTTKKDVQRSNESQEVWSIDRKEVEWAAANIESILAGVGLEPYAGSGLKINSIPEGSFAAERGFRAGDVIKAINNQQIGSLQQLDTVMRSLSKNATSLTVQVDRSGRVYTLTYNVPRAPR
jgi:hypothetical protein